jgi:CDP-diglyceride synthetase
MPLAITWLCDSFAMWGGKLIGGPKLAPSVSRQ